MKIALIAASALLLASCSSSGSSGATSSDLITDPGTDFASSTSADDTGACTLPNDHDIVYWTKTPGQPATAQELGAVNLALCENVSDSLEQTAPLGPGYCTIVADLRDNPGYNFDAVPAAKPRNPAAQAGGGC